MDNDALLEAAKEAIIKLFGDMSVSQNQTKHNLEEIKGEIDTMLETLEDN